MESRSSYGYYGSAGGYTGESVPQKKVIPRESEYYIVTYHWNGKSYDTKESKHSNSREYVEGLFNTVKLDKDNPVVQLWEVGTYGKHLIWDKGNTYRGE